MYIKPYPDCFFDSKGMASSVTKSLQENRENFSVTIFDVSP